MATYIRAMGAGWLVLMLVALTINQTPCDGFWLGLRVFFNMTCK